MQIKETRIKHFSTEIESWHVVSFVKKKELNFFALHPVLDKKKFLEATSLTLNVWYYMRHFVQISLKCNA